MLLNLSTTGFGGPVPAYPDRGERNPKKKKPEYIAQMIRAHVHECLRDANFKHWYNARALNEERLLYMFGKQDGKKYDRFIDPANKETDPTGISQRIDRRILPLVPKHVRILSDKLEEQEFAPTVTVVDEQGEQEKADHLDTIRLWQQQGEFFKSQGIRPPEELPGDLPQDEEDLRLYAANEYQHDEAVSLEQKLALCLADANYKQLDRDVVLHFFAFGEACAYAGTGLSGRPLPSLLLPGRCFFLPSSSEDYRDMRAGAHLEYLTLGQLRAEAGDQLKEEDYELIERNATTRPAGDWALPSGLGRAADSGLVQVVRGSFLSEDDMVWKTRTDMHGNEQTRRKSADYKNTTPGEVTRATATNVYEGTLIVGTELFYNCRLAVKQLRDMDNPLLGRLPYTPMTPGMLVGQSSCPMDEVMGIADFCQEQWLRLQEACLRAVPQGYNFDPEVLLESISLLKTKAGLDRDGGLDLAPTIEMFYRTGNTTSKRMGRDKQIMPPAVTKNDTGVPTDVIQYWQNLRSGIQMLEAIMGSNAVVSAATPNPETGKGQSELAVAGTLSSLGALAHGKQQLFEGVCRAMGLRIWLQEKRSPVTGTLAGKPGQAPMAVKPRPSITKRRFAFRIERLPTKQEWADFYAVAQRSIDSKEITMADYAYLVEIDNLKLARRLLAQRAKRNVAQKMQQDQQNQQATFEGQAKAAEAAEAAKQKTIQVQLQADVTIETLRGRNSATVATIYADAQHRAEQTRADAQQQKTETQETGQTFRDALGHDAGQQQAAQQAASAGFSDLVPAEQAA